MDLVLSLIKAPRFSGLTGQTHVFSQSGGSFGRGETNAWVLPDPQRFISTVHGRIEWRDGAFLLTDQSTNGIFINGSDVPLGKGRHYSLRAGDVLVFGDYEARVDVRESPNQIAARAMERSAAAADPDKTGIYHTPPPQIRAQMAQAGAPLTEPQAQANDQSADPVTQLMAALGLEQLPPSIQANLASQVGDLLHGIASRLMEALRARAALKSELHMSLTSIQTSENNPLKFAVTADEALEKMFLKAGRGYLSPKQSFDEALQDIEDHHVALLDAMRVAYGKLIEGFDPARLEDRLEGAKQGGLLPGSRRARAWDNYRQFFQEIGQDPNQRFQQLFGEHFAHAYELRLAQLKSQRRR